MPSSSVGLPACRDGSFPRRRTTTLAVALVWLSACGPDEVLAPFPALHLASGPTSDWWTAQVGAPEDLRNSSGCLELPSDTRVTLDGVSPRDLGLGGSSIDSGSILYGLHTPDRSCGALTADFRGGSLGLASLRSTLELRLGPKAGPRRAGTTATATFADLLGPVHLGLESSRVVRVGTTLRFSWAPRPERIDLGRVVVQVETGFRTSHTLGAARASPTGFDVDLPARLAGELQLGPGQVKAWATATAEVVECPGFATCTAEKHWGEAFDVTFVE